MDGTRKIIAEFVGAFTLIFAGVSAIEMGDGGGGLVGERSLTA